MILKAVLIIGILVIWICLGFRVSDFGFSGLFLISNFSSLLEVMYASSKQQGTIWSTKRQFDSISNFDIRISKFSRGWLVLTNPTQ